MQYKIRHYSLDEYRCPCCNQVTVAVGLVYWLDILRCALGVPVRINSGYRCPQHNVEVGGAVSSRHLIGCAADIAKPASVDYNALVALVKRLSTAEWEIVTYTSRTYVHVGVPRDCRAQLWDGERSVVL